jgi:hypothetical protein
MSYVEKIHSQILDSRKRSWSAAEYDGDADTFFTEVVIPLRQLRSLGMFDALDEVPFNVDGESFIGVIDVIGPINFAVALTQD